MGFRASFQSQDSPHSGTHRVGGPGRRLLETACPGQKNVSIRGKALAAHRSLEIRDSAISKSYAALKSKYLIVRTGHHVNQ
jgi:hypothetical protein